MKNIIISFICPDRPGVVDTLSNIVKKQLGNWQSSSMHQLSGFFAGILEIAITEDNAESLINEIESIPDIKTQIVIAMPKLMQEQRQKQQSEQKTLTLELTANDRTGIIQDITSQIHQQKGNLIKLVSRQSNAPHTGQSLFNAKVILSVKEKHIDKLINALENLADDLMVDIIR